MNYFDQTADNVIKAIVTYYQDTQDTSIATLSFRDLIDKIKNHAPANIYLTTLHHLLEQEESGFAGPVSGVLASVKKMWNAEVSLLAFEQPESNPNDIRHILSGNQVQILNTRLNEIINVIHLNPLSERFIIYHSTTTSTEDKIFFIDEMIKHFGKGKDEVQLIYYNKMGQVTSDLSDSAFAVFRSPTPIN